MEPTIRRVLPIRQDITYWFCFTGAETEIHKIKDDIKIKIEKNINRRGQRHIVNFWHLSAELGTRSFFRGSLSAPHSIFAPGSLTLMRSFF